MLSLVKQGRLRVLAVTTAKRLDGLTEYPTLAESYPGYETGNWYGVLVPSKTSREIISALHKASLAALKTPAVSKRMGELGYITIGNTPEEFGAHIRSEIDKLAKVLAPLRGSVQ
jgi:tripartite-type tricarboxylate transporter receptor subunit TctC